MQYDYACRKCGKQFQSPKQGKKYCSTKCYHARFSQVTKPCEVCGTEFTVAYRFRGTKTCSNDCARASTSLALTTRVTKQCIACGKDFEVVKSREDHAGYCCYDPCFLSTRKTRQPDVTKKCECCGVDFTVSFVRKEQRFCGRSCASMDENNGQYGLGKEQAWNLVPRWHVGLTSKTDDRLRNMGEKISMIMADKMVNGTWSPPSTGFKGEHYVGQKNGAATSYLRSSYESMYARMLDSDPQVASWEHEPMRIPYMFEGSTRNYVPDFLVTHVDGRKTLVEVKPDTLVRTAQNEAKLRAAIAWCELNGVSFTIVSERELCNSVLS